MTHPTRASFVTLAASAPFAACSRRDEASEQLAAALHLLPQSTSLIGMRAGEPAPRVARNADAVAPAASLAKLLIAVTYADAIAARRIDPAMVVTPEASVATLTPSELPLGNPRPALPVGLWLRRMLVRSSNLAANVLVHAVGLGTVNETALALGLRVTRLHGFFLETQAHIAPRTHTTASEMVTLLQAIHVRSNDLDDRRRNAYRRIVVDMNDVADRRFAKAVVPPNTVTVEKTGEISGFIGSAAIVDPLATDAVLLVSLVSGTPDVHREAAYEAAVARIDDVLRLTYSLCAR